MKIHIDEDNQILIVTGHADYAEYGKDIVCAGVSALVQTLALYAIEHGGTAEMRSGYAKIDAGNGTKDVFLAICAGLRELAKAYPSVWVT